jgi:flagellar protein FlbD
VQEVRQKKKLRIAVLLTLRAYLPDVSADKEEWSVPESGAMAPSRRTAMIKLTRLNNQPLVVNSDLIKCVENAPDTVLTLVTGEKIIVRETTEQVLERVIAFRRAILAGLAPATQESNGNLPAVPCGGLEGASST